MGIETTELVDYLYKNFSLVMAPFPNYWKIKVNERGLDLRAPSTCETRNNILKTEGLNESLLLGR